MGEVELGGGQMSGRVVRSGRTVRRGAGPWTPTVHRLLRHVRGEGVRWVPRVRGFDDQGREVLEYIEGEVGHGDPAWIRSDVVLADVARALRQWHDATVTFEPGSEAVWYFPGRQPFEVIAHNDFAPYNHVFRDGRFVGAIDYDVCYPASRAWDAAWTAYRYIPLTPTPDDRVNDGVGADRSPFAHEQAIARLRRFAEEYDGGDPTSLDGVAGILAALPGRLDAIADWCAEQSIDALRRNGNMYRTHARWIETGPFAEPV